MAGHGRVALLKPLVEVLDMKRGVSNIVAAVEESASFLSSCQLPGLVARRALAFTHATTCSAGDCQQERTDGQKTMVR